MQIATTPRDPALELQMRVYDLSWIIRIGLVDVSAGTGHQDSTENYIILKSIAIEISHTMVFNN